MSETKDGFTVQDMLLLIGVQTRTGELVVESGNNIGSIVFHRGVVLQAFSPYSRAIGDLMVEDGVITEAELFEALEHQRKKMSVPIGTLLLQTGKVSFTMIEKLVHDQIRSAIRDFSAWESVHFSFVAKEVTPFDKIQLQVQDLLLPDTITAVQQFLERKQGAGIQPAITSAHSSGFPAGK